MREKQFLIKYRFREKVGGDEEEEKEDEFDHAIDLSKEINKGIISSLTYEGILEILRNENIMFKENSIKIQSDIYWMKLDEEFEINFQSYEEDWEYNEILLLLERETDDLLLHEINKNIEKFQVTLEAIDSKQSELTNYIGELDIKLRESVEDILPSMDSKLINLQETVDKQLNFLGHRMNYMLEILLQRESHKKDSIDTPYLIQSFNNFPTNQAGTSPNHQVHASLTGDFKSQSSIQNDLRNYKDQTFKYDGNSKQSLNNFSYRQNHEQGEKDSFFNFPKQNSIIEEQQASQFPQDLAKQEQMFNQNSLHSKFTPSEGTISSISKFDSKKMQISSLVFPDMNKNMSQNIQNNAIPSEIADQSIINNNKIVAQQHTQSSPKTSSQQEETNPNQNMFQFQFFRSSESSKQQQDTEESESKPIILFQVPEDGSDEIDFFKNLKPKTEAITPKDDKVTHKKAEINIKNNTNENNISKEKNNSNINSVKNIINQSHTSHHTEKKPMFTEQNLTKMNTGTTPVNSFSPSFSLEQISATNISPINSNKIIQKNSDSLITNSLGKGIVRNEKKSDHSPIHHGEFQQSRHSNKPLLSQLTNSPKSSSGEQSLLLSSGMKTGISNKNINVQFISPSQNELVMRSSNKLGMLDSQKTGNNNSNNNSNHSNHNHIHIHNNNNNKRIGSQRQTRSQNSQNNKIHQIASTDMTIMYSDPFVKVSEPQSNVFLPAGDPVDYELEIQKLNEFLNETNKQIKLDIVVASLDNLEKAITRNTKILHIMCHGDYSEKDQNYFLSFEDEESKLDCVTSKRFQEFFKNKNNNVQLVFFNACHSEEVGKIFQEAGIPFVIAVQSDLKIEDRAALTFSSSFYMNIFSGNSVQQSFNSAKSSLQARLHENCFTCCCAHSHDDNCQWFIEAMSGFNSAHEMHKPDGRCKCPKSKQLYHEYKCQWAHEFLAKYRENSEEYIENMFQNGGELFVCCCHTEATPHDESLKFRLIKNGNTEDRTIMENLPEGQIIQKSNIDFNNLIFQDSSKIFGRNVDMFKMYRCLMINQKLKTKFVGLNGELGCGKTAVAKKVARHLMERGQVNKIIIEDFEKMKTKITKFEQKMRLGQHTKELGYEILKTSKPLFILDNCDDLIKNNKSKFEEIISGVAMNTPAKFIIISLGKHELKFGAGPILQVTLGDLKEFFVQQLLDFYAGDFIRENLLSQPNFSQQLDELLKIMPKSPKTIMETVHNFAENKDITQILNSFHNCIQTDKSKEYAAFNLLMKELKSQNPQAYEMLLLISLFPHGVSVEDLKFLKKQKKIPHDWIDIMESLTMFKYESQANAGLFDQHELPEIGLNGLKKMQSRRMFSICKGAGEDQEEDDFDNDENEEEQHRFKKFKNGQYFWMSVTRNFEIVTFKIKKFVVEQLKQPEYKEDIFPKDLLILEYLSIFSKKLLKHLRKKSLHQEKLIEYCSLSRSGIFGLKLYENQIQTIKVSNSHLQLVLHPANASKNDLPQSIRRSSTTHSLAPRCQSSSNNLLFRQLKEGAIETSSNFSDDEFNSNKNSINFQNFSENKRGSISKKEALLLADNIEENVFKILGISDVFKLHEGNFYSYLNVEDHKHLISFISKKTIQLIDI